VGLALPSLAASHRDPARPANLAQHLKPVLAFGPTAGLAHPQIDHYTRASTTQASWRAAARSMSLPTWHKTNGGGVARALDHRTTGWPGYAVSQRVRKRVEEIFGWIKTVGNFRRTRYRGVERTSFAAYLVGTAYNLLRIAKLCPAG
jgi:IS5 family transposase